MDTDQASGVITGFELKDQNGPSSQVSLKVVTSCNSAGIFVTIFCNIPNKDMYIRFISLDVLVYFFTAMQNDYGDMLMKDNVEPRSVTAYNMIFSNNNFNPNIFFFGLKEITRTENASPVDIQMTISNNGSWDMTFGSHLSWKIYYIYF